MFFFFNLGGCYYSVFISISVFIAVGSVVVTFLGGQDGGQLLVCVFL